MDFQHLILFFCILHSVYFSASTNYARARADGRAAQLLTAGTINIGIGTSDEVVYKTASLLVSGVSLPISIVALDTWMTSLIVAVTVSIIILALVVVFSRREAKLPIT